jgi:hypothetical protein
MYTKESRVVPLSYLIFFTAIHFTNLSTYSKTMDSDRWNMAWILQSRPSREQQQEEATHNATPSTAATATPNRYQHDIEQALAMRKSMAQPQPQSSSNSNNNSSAREDDVRLGFVGLDQAEEQAQQGNLSEALRLYELSIELLIRFLRGTTHYKSTATTANSTPAAGQNSNIDLTTDPTRVGTSVY